MSSGSVSSDPRALGTKKVWTCLLTNTSYLSALLTLDYSLKRAKSAYPLVVLYTDSFPLEGHTALDVRKIPKRRIDYLLPEKFKDYSNEPRFYECWSKLAVYSLVEYDRVVMLDADMLVLRNMDELMDLELDPPSLNGTGNRVLAASHACVCNPLKKPHYPPDWIPENCGFTQQHGKPDRAQIEGSPNTSSLGIPNSGLQVLNPSQGVYELILKQLGNDEAVQTYEFPDQDMLADLFRKRWVPLPYIYNALKTLRQKGVHDQIWRDDSVKNIHYILSPKPWDEENKTDTQVEGMLGTHRWWFKANEERLAEQRANGIEDGF